MRRKQFDNAIELANRRGVECETARALRMKAIVQKQMRHSTGSDQGEGQDLVKEAERILQAFQVREKWDLSEYTDEEERYDMLVCGQRR